MKYLLRLDGVSVGACLGAWTMAVAVLPAGADTPVVPIGMASCAAIESDSERLACYDRLAGRAAPPQAAMPVPQGQVSMPAPLPADSPKKSETTAVATPSGPGLQPRRGRSLWSTFWELDSGDKHGTFNFKTYRPNFLLPLHYTSSINRLPESPTRPSTGDRNEYKPIEAKLQVSLRTKVAQNLLLPDADLWFGYTQQSLWQVWNRKESAPFRNTDFEPELIYVVPVPEPLRPLPHGWDFRMVHLGLAHQSNGQTEPLSRSWNRVYLAAGLEKGDVSVYARLHKRLPEDADDNDNPDLTSYVGRGDIAVAWLPGRATASLRWRTNLRNFRRGSWQFDWTFPVDGGKPDGLRWYVQAFTGYGETLLDYNHPQTSLGVGLTLFEF